ncbi:MAG TPA: class I SAM-dependent methyltransferase [Ignavibacteriaceae bacterium]|nr:class I SAM-dependent methyltransferase [Ignavibacteriaceae bacterium]
MNQEENEIKIRYEKRKNISSDRYSILNPASILIEQEKERALIKWIKENNIEPLENKKLLEIGCGGGYNLLKFVRLGFKPQNIFANDLISERLQSARELLPSKVHFYEGSAMDLSFKENEFDIVFQSMVFSSILDSNYKIKLAEKMWQWVKPGGGILWYDFIYNNPSNKDVKGVSIAEVKKLFKVKKLYYKKLTLAPPVARIVTKVHPFLYYFFNSTYLLRTHLLIWIQK